MFISFVAFLMKWLLRLFSGTGSPAFRLDGFGWLPNATAGSASASESASWSISQLGSLPPCSAGPASASEDQIVYISRAKLSSFVMLSLPFVAQDSTEQPWKPVKQL